MFKSKIQTVEARKVDRKCYSVNQSQACLKQNIQII